MGRRLVAGLLVWLLMVPAVPAEAVVVTAPVWFQMREMAGFIASPRQSDVIAEALHYGYLLPEEVDDLELEYYQAELPFYGLDGRLEGRATAVFQVYQKKEGGDSRSLIVSFILALWAVTKGSGITRCVWQYDDDTKRLPCVEWIGSRFGQSDWQARADRWLVTSGEKLDLNLRRVQAAAGAYRLLVLEKDQYTGEVHKAGKLLPTYVPLDVPAQIIPEKGRMVVPLRFVEHAGLGVEWDPNARAATIRRPSDSFWVRYSIGSARAETSNGQELEFDVAPSLLQGRTMVGLRATLQSFCDVLWQRVHQRAILTCGS